MVFLCHATPSVPIIWASILARPNIATVNNNAQRIIDPLQIMLSSALKVLTSVLKLDPHRSYWTQVVGEVSAVKF